MTSSSDHPTESSIATLARQLEAAAVGAEMYGLIAEAYPLCRSITGDGFRKTLAILKGHVPLDVHEVPTGTRVFDWTVPKEWNIDDAYVKDPTGMKVVDFKKHSLHVLNYSVPIHAKMSLKELLPHLFSLPQQPDLIPYRTSYYNETWGFCLPHRVLESLPDGEYEVSIESTLRDGSLTYGEYFLPGESSDEVLISTHCCHPSLCNDNLSGMALATMLAKLITTARRRLSYRFLFIPGAIGSITWLARNEHRVNRIKHGLVVACVGDRGSMTYKKSRRGDADIDRAVQHVLHHSGAHFTVREFSPYGYDERQFCSPGFNLPVGSLTRTPHGEFTEYHTSADNLELVRPEWLADSLQRYLEVLEVVEGNTTLENLNPKCEPQLGRRGVYSTIGGMANSRVNELGMLWVLNLSDGKHSLIDIAERSGLHFRIINSAARILKDHHLVKELDRSVGETAHVQPLSRKGDTQ